MNYSMKSFSVMPGGTEEYRNNYDRVFRGEKSQIEEALTEITEKEFLAKYPDNLRVSTETRRFAIETLRKARLFVIADLVESVYTDKFASMIESDFSLREIFKR